MLYAPKVDFVAVFAYAGMRDAFALLMLISLLLLPMQGCSAEAVQGKRTEPQTPPVNIVQVSILFWCHFYSHIAQVTCLKAVTFVHSVCIYSYWLCT